MGVRRFECLHQGDLLFDTLFTDVAFLLRVESALIGKHLQVAFTYDAFGVLPVPFFSGIEQQIEVKAVYLVGISEMGFELLDEIVPDHQPVVLKEPRKPDVRE